MRRTLLLALYFFAVTFNAAADPIPAALQGTWRFDSINGTLTLITPGSQYPQVTISDTAVFLALPCIPIILNVN